MFSITEQTATLAHINVRTERHGEEPAGAADLKIQFTAGNGVLSEFHPRLRHALYKAEENPAQGSVDGVWPEPTVRVFGDLIEKIRLKHELVGAKVLIDFGLGGDYGSQFYVQGVRVGEIPEVFKSEDRDHDIRLVALYWEPKAEHTYNVRIARYSDGSGDKSRRVFLGRTQQEAMDAAAAHVAEQQKFHQNDHYYPQIGLWLEHFGYGHLITPNVREKMEAYKVTARENLAKHAREELARAEAALAAARANAQQAEQAA